MDLENNSLLYPDSTLNLAINILNRGLLDAHDLCLTMNISDDNEYSYSDSITNISLTSWNSTSYRFSWQVPDVEGLRYTITFELPDDNDNNNNELTIQTRAHFHALNISTEKDYYSTGVNGLMRYTLKIENHGSFGSDNVSIEFNRPNDWGWWIELDGKIVNDIVIINSEIIELFVEANTTLDQYHMEFYVISENNWTKDSQKLIGFVVDRDLEIINISYYRNDGKEAQVVEGELSKISLTILNYGSQSAGIFGIWLFLDGYETSDVYIPSLTCNETKIVDFMISLPKGDHNLTFWLDKNDTVMEYNDLNNKRGQDISVRSENSSSSFNFNVIVVDITGKVKKDSTVCVYLDNEKYSNTTDIEGFTTVILPAPFKEGSIIRLEAWEEEIYSSAEVRVYSEDESIDISMTVSKYSMRVRCNDRLRPITPGENNIYLINITNMGDLPDTYNIDIAGIPNGWSYNLSGEGLEMGSFYLENDLSCDLRLNISSDKYTIFGSNIEINITIRSSIYWRFNEYCIIKPYLELIDNITLFSSTSILSGKPGDSLYHEIIISNEGNALRNVTMLQFGDVEYSALNKNIVRLQPGTSKSCWLSIKVPNLAAPTKLHQTVYGVFSPEGSTNSLIFTTVIQPFSEIKAEIIDNELHITNQGNIHEELILHIGLDTGVIIPDIDKVILGIGETRSVPLRIEMTDLSIEAGNPQVVSVTIFNGEEYSYFTKLITVPEVQDISFFVENYDNSVSPGEMIQICMVIQNNGNTVEKISFTCQNSGPEPLIIPVIMDLDPGEITDAIFQLYLPEDAYGPRVISISGISEWNTTTIDIELMVEEDFTIELHEMSVSQRSGKTRYKVNLYNKGSTDEFVTLESDYGIVDIELMVLESGSSRTVYLTLDESEIPQDGINLIVYSQRCKDMWTNISILPPPRTSITILGDFPGRVGTPLQLQAAGIGNFMWDIDGNILYGKTINYSFKRSGNHEIKLILTDSRGLTFRCNKTLLLENTKPQLNVPSHMYVQIGEYVRFDASEINDPDGMIADYIWIIENQKYYRPVVYHIFETSGEFNVTLIIIDDLDGMNTTNIQVFAQKIEKVVEVEEKNLDTEIIYTTSVFLIICITVILYVFISMDNKEDRIIKQLLSMKSESVPPSPSLQEYNDSVKSKDQINEIAPDNNRMCKECNANIPEHFSYCHKCGVNLDETIDSGLVNISNVEDERRQGSNEKGDDQMINNLNFCPSCGCTLPKFYNYCNKCGLALPKPLEKMNTDNRSNNET